MTDERMTELFWERSESALEEVQKHYGPSLSSLAMRLLGSPEDAEEIEIFYRLAEEKPIYFFISDLEWFIKLIYDAELDMRGFLENILEKGKLLNIYFIGVIGLENITNVDYQTIFEIFVGYKTGIHFGGNTNENRIYNFEEIPYKEQSVLLKPGIGLISNRLNSAVQKIIVPLARR